MYFSIYVRTGNKKCNQWTDRNCQKRDKWLGFARGLSTAYLWFRAPLSIDFLFELWMNRSLAEWRWPPSSRNFASAWEARTPRTSQWILVRRCKCGERHPRPFVQAKLRLFSFQKRARDTSTVDCIIAIVARARGASSSKNESSLLLCRLLRTWIVEMYLQKATRI